MYKCCNMNKQSSNGMRCEFKSNPKIISLFWNFRFELEVMKTKHTKYLKSGKKTSNILRRREDTYIFFFKIIIILSCIIPIFISFFSCPPLSEEINVSLQQLQINKSKKDLTKLFKEKKAALNCDQTSVKGFSM